jgi:transaldolase
MKLFIDTGNLRDIETYAALGIIDGVTTNPSLMAKEAGDYRTLLEKICHTVQGPVSAEVLSTDADSMVSEGKDLHAIHPSHIVVKVPFGKEGIKACRALRGEQIRVNVTLVFSPTQALLAAKAGATYVSPFVGRLDDIATDGMQLIEHILQIYDNYDFTTEVLVASVRHPMHVAQAARMGADICTCPVPVLEAIFKHPLTDLGLERFLKDWETAKGAKA